MDKGKTNRTTIIIIIGAILLGIILVGGTILTGRRAHNDTVDAVRSVSLMYLDELAGRREQVVEDNLKDNINVINIAIGLISDEDLSDLEHMRAYQRNMKQLFSLERFAFVDSDGLVYTADEGIQNDIDQYSFDPQTITDAEISVKNLQGTNKKVVIAVPIRDKGLFIDGKRLDVCFMEIDMDVMLQGISMKSQNSGATFCNIYTSGGVALSNTVLGGLAVEDNLLEALKQAQYEGDYSAEGVTRDFREGNANVVSFTYDGIQETLSYVPVKGTDWMLTYLIRESVISDRISSVSDGIIRRSLIQSGLTALVLVAVFAYIFIQNRRNAQLRLEKETAETENRIKHQEMEQRLALQEELLEQKANQEEQARMITALSSDFRSVYYLKLDENKGICYQARSDMDGLRTGDQFPYIESVTAYCDQYVMPEYREDFMRFVRPDAIREGLKENRVISYRYMIDVNGKTSYELVRFAGVRHPEDREDHLVHSVSACFTDVDAETRKEIDAQHALGVSLRAAEEASKANTRSARP